MSGIGNADENFVSTTKCQHSETIFRSVIKFKVTMHFVAQEQTGCDSSYQAVIIEVYRCRFQCCFHAVTHQLEVDFSLQCIYFACFSSWCIL